MKKFLALTLAILFIIPAAGGCRSHEPVLCDDAGCVGDTWVHSENGTTVVYVPGGTFQMGSDESDESAEADEFPRHKVTVDGFWMDRTEVTNAQFAAFLDARGIGLRMGINSLSWRRATAKSSG